MAQVERVSPEEEAGLRREAELVASHLRWVGMAVVFQGSSIILEHEYVEKSGARVFYEPIAEDSGVYVTWDPSGALLAEVVRGDHAAIMSGEVAIDAMLAALTAVLTEAGWAVDAEDIGTHESCLKVIPTASSPREPRI